MLQKSKKTRKPCSADRISQQSEVLNLQYRHRSTRDFRAESKEEKVNVDFHYSDEDLNHSDLAGVSRPTQDECSPEWTAVTASCEAG